jgi:predicted dehydrogenase
MAERTLRVALLGQGFMGRAHSNAYHQAPHFFDTRIRLERKVLCGRNRQQLEAMADRWGWEEIATDWREVVTRDDIDLVDVALPNYLHAPASIAAAEAGKIVLCEKPLATSEEEAERMVAAAGKAPTMVWYNYRRAPAVAFAKRLVDEDRIGKPYHYRATYLQEWGNDPTRPPSWKTDKAQAGSGVIGDLMSHLVDTALLLNGPIDEVTALGKTFVAGRQIEDAALVLVRFANGSVGSIEATRYAVGCQNRNAFEIHGAKGMAAFNLEDMNRLEFHDATEGRGTRGLRSFLVTGPDHPYAARFWKPGHIIGYEHTFIAALGDFLGSLESGEPFHPDFRDGLRVQAVLEAVSRSCDSRTWETVRQFAA